MSPRRSSRARQHQLPSAGLGHSTSNSSQSSNRPERNITSILQQEKPLLSESPQLSVEGNLDGMETLEQQARQTRPKRRGTDIKDDPAVIADVEEAIEEDADEEEVTRCVCRRQDYPGPPIPLEEGSRSHKAKDQHNGSIISIAEALPDDAGSLFIQCDDCKVWQHGGCVGIMDESMSPENYYCEECRKDLHKLMIGARGQRYSRYLPVYEAAHPSLVKPTRKSPTSKDSDSRSSGDPETRGSAGSAILSAGKRRSTMNSRAAMDEEEAFRKAIEESRTDGSVAGTVNGSRKGKRVRDDSEEIKQDLKRRKTGSESESPRDQDLPQLGDDSDEEAMGSKGRTSNAVRKARGAAAQVQRDRDLREREKERERERAEAAGRRKGRAEKRHAEELEAAEEALRAGMAAKVTPTTRTAKTATVTKSTPAAAVLAPTVASPSTSATVSHKKQTKPVTRRGRLGRNQYSKDRDPMADNQAESPRPPHSRDGEEVCSTNGETTTSHGPSNSGKPSKPRHLNPNKTSMNEMRKRAAGILEYISRTQVEMAGEKTTPTISSTTISIGTRPPLARHMSVNGMSKLSRQLGGDDIREEKDEPDKEKEKVRYDEKGFRQMSTTQMMDVLTRELVHWQKDYGKWGER